MNINQEISLTESIAMSKASAVSTPTVSRVEKVSLDDLFNLMKANFSEQNHKFDAQNIKFDKLNSDINAKLHELSSNVSEQKIRCESSFNNFNDKFNEQNVKFDTLSSNINNRFDEENNKFDDKFNEINVKVTESQLSLIHI